MLSCSPALLLSVSSSPFLPAGNGAIIHYHPEAADAPAVMDGSQMLLLDSGGQYLEGTTDVTRTVHLGTPTSWQRECFTRVLKGRVHLTRTRAPLP